MALSDAKDWAGRSVLANAATVLLFSAKRAKRSRLELSVGGGTRGGAVEVVVVGGWVGKVIGREKAELDLDGGFGSSLHASEERNIDYAM